MGSLRAAPIDVVATILALAVAAIIDLAECSLNQIQA